MANLQKIDFGKINTLVQDDLAAGKRVLDRVDEINLRQLGTNANALISDLRDVAKQLKTFTTSTNGTSQATLQKIASDADALVGQVQQTIGRLDQTIGNVDINVLNETLENLRRASREFERPSITSNNIPRERSSENHPNPRKAWKGQR